MKFNILTIFPHIISDYCNESILKRAQEKKAITVLPIDIRNFAEDKHHTVDDTPYGGGAGMVMKPEPLYKALESISALSSRATTPEGRGVEGSVRKRTIVLSPRGRQFDQRLAEEWANLDELTLVCGRYEGIDQRVIDHMIDEEVSVGPYVLAGGELGALIIIEAITRLLPGVLGNPDSIVEETHSTTCEEAEYPQYTKPADFMGRKVPDVLLSGNHAEIEMWRREQRKK